MPTLKIGCRVEHKDRGEAILKDFDVNKAMPWLLQTGSGLIWASHKDFSNFDATRIRQFDAANSSRASKFEARSLSAKPRLLAGLLNNVFRPRTQASNHL